MIKYISKAIKLLKQHEGIFLILVFAFFLRIPSLFEPYWHGDEGIYLTLGMAMRKGLVFYGQIHDNKPPLLYLLAGISATQFWFRFILLWWNLASIYVFYLLSGNIFKKQKLALISTLLFTLLTATQEGNIPNAEIFMILPTTIAMLLIYKTVSCHLSAISCKKYYFLAGVLFSIAMLFKVPGGFSFAAAVCFLVFFKEPKKLIHLTYNLLYLISGFIILPLISVIYYLLQGAGPQYLKAAFFQNIGYLSSWGGEWNKPLVSSSSEFSQRGLCLAIILLILWLLRKHLSKAFLLIILWFFFDLFAALLSGRPYQHYLIQVIPSLSLLVFFLFTQKKYIQKGIVVASLLILFFSYFHYHFWTYPFIKYYKNYIDFGIKQKTKQDYFSFFDSRVNQTYKLAKIIKTFSSENDYIYIWGNEPYLYALSDRLPSGRYTTAYHVIDFNGWQETLKSIDQNKPELIIKIKNEKSFPGLEERISTDYQKIYSTSNAEVFKRK